MFDMGSLLAALNGMKTAKDLAVAALDARDANRMSAAVTQLNSQIINAQQGILELQAGMLQMLAENHRLQEEINQSKAAQNLRARHEPVQLCPGHFAYRLKESPQDRHYVCQPCLDVRRQEVSLMRRDRGAYGVDYFCPECKVSWHSDEASLRGTSPGLASGVASADPWGRNT